VPDSDEPQDKAYLISFMECSIVRCRGKGRKKKGGEDQAPEPDEPRNQG